MEGKVFLRASLKLFSKKLPLDVKLSYLAFVRPLVNLK